MIKQLFASTPEDACFDLAYKLSFVLHEGAVSRGYKGYLPWDAGKCRTTDDDFYHWGFSACSEPEGVTVMKGNTVMISSNKQMRPLSNDTIRHIHNAVRPYADKAVLTVLLHLYELTINDFDLYVPIDAIAEAANLPAGIVDHALSELPVQTKTLDNGEDGYRIEGSYMHIPAILHLLTQA